MKPVNVLPTFVSQDTELKNKDSLAPMSDSKKGADFSFMVNHHSRSDKSEATQSKSQPASNDVSDVKSGNESSHSDQTRQESDSSKVSQDFDDVSQKLSQETGDEHSVNQNAEISEDNESLHESEQFISLLYNSDQTLTQSNVQQGESDNLSQLKAVVGLNSEEQGTENTKAQLITKLSATESEHKLKSFSQEELLIRASLKRDALIPQPNDQVLKAYQQSLQTQESGESNKLTEEIPSADKLKEVTNGLFHGRKDQITGTTDKVLNEVMDKADKNVSALSEKALAKGEVASEATATAKMTLLEEGGESVNLSSVSKVSQSEQKATDVLSNANGKANLPEHDKSSSLKVTDNLIKEQKTTLFSENEIASETQQKSKLTTGLEPIAAEVFKGKLNKESLGQVNGSNDKQIPSPQLNDSLKHSEEEAVVDDFITSSLLPEQKASESIVKVEGKVVEPMLRTTQDLHAQGLQSNQAKQSNDAYMEFQSSEVLNHSVASDTAHIQKNNVQLQQETISIFRKDFTDAVKEKVMVMINQKIQQFDILLDPPEFGNMHVRVNLQGEQAAVNFTVQNQQAKEALEQNMHKLKDMLAEQGVDVGGANVEQQSQQEKNDRDAIGKQNGNQGLMSEQASEEQNIEQILSAELFDSSAVGVDYYA